MIVRITVKAGCHTTKAPCIHNPYERSVVFVTKVSREGNFGEEVTVVNLPASPVREPTNDAHKICGLNYGGGKCCGQMDVMLRNETMLTESFPNGNFQLVLTGICQHQSHLGREFLGLKALGRHLLVTSRCI